MPWYMNPEMTRKVLNRIADRHSNAHLRDLRVVLDGTLQNIWNKQENYHKKMSPSAPGCDFVSSSPQG